jgi:RNA polymerase sigma-70 factor, ECF subfamily
MADIADRVYWRVLVVRCQIGDRAALEELVAQCQPRLRAFLHKMLGDRQAIDDVAQDVWADVFRDLRKLNDTGAFVPWFYAIARNRTFRLLRDRGNAKNLATIDEQQLADDSDDEPDFTAEDAQAVHTGMDRLVPEHREVLFLRFMEEMSYQEIAAVVGAPVGTVRSRIHNAKRTLREILKKSGVT